MSAVELLHNFSSNFQVLPQLTQGRKRVSDDSFSRESFHRDHIRRTSRCCGAALYAVSCTVLAAGIGKPEDHIEILMAANTQALAKPLWDLDVDSIRQITGTLINEKGIRVIRVVDGLGKLDLTESSLRDASEELDTMSKPILYRSGDRTRHIGTITVQFTRIGLFSALNRMELAFVSIFIVAILTVFGTAIIGNRIMVMKPLLRLTAAIEATRRLGSRHHVDWRSTDEMAALPRASTKCRSSSNGKSGN